MTHRVFVVVLLTLTLIHSGLTIDCHQCASWADAECGDPYEGDNMDGCDDRDTHCLKIKIMNTLYDSGFITGEPRVTVTSSRGCIRADDEGDYCVGSEIAGGLMIKCICSEDGCNSGRNLLPSILLSIAASLVAVLLWKRP